VLRSAAKAAIVVAIYRFSRIKFDFTAQLLLQYEMLHNVALALTHITAANLIVR
jgi:hypothetical protein